MCIHSLYQHAQYFTVDVVKDNVDPIFLTDVRSESRVEVVASVSGYQANVSLTPSFD